MMMMMRDDDDDDDHHHDLKIPRRPSGASAFFAVARGSSRSLGSPWGPRRLSFAEMMMRDADDER